MTTTTTTTNTYDMPSTKAFSLLSLPLEVRNMIYKHYFSDLYITVKREQPTAEYDSAIIGQPQPSHAWNEQDTITNSDEVWPLLTSCKTIAIEARPALCSSATFVFLNSETFIDCSHDMRVPGLPLRLPGETSDSINPFQHMERLWLDLTEPGDMTGLSQLEQQIKVAEVHSNELPLLRSLVHNLPVLKHLNITIMPNCDLFIDGWPLQPMRRRPIMAICQLKDLESFELAVAPSRLTTEAATIDRAIRETVAKLSQILAEHVVKNASDSTTHRLNHDGCSSLELQLRVVSRMLASLERDTPMQVVANHTSHQLRLEDQVIRSRK